MNCLCLEKKIFTNPDAYQWAAPPGSLAAKAAKFQTKLDTLHHQAKDLTTLFKQQMTHLDEASGKIGCNHAGRLLKSFQYLSAEATKRLKTIRVLQQEVNACKELPPNTRAREIKIAWKTALLFSNLLKASNLLSNHFSLMLDRSSPEDRTVLRSDRFFSPTLPLLARKIFEGFKMTFTGKIQSGSFGAVYVVQIGDQQFAGKRALNRPIAKTLLQREFKLLSTTPPHKSLVSPPILHREISYRGTVSTLLFPLYKTDLYEEMFRLDLSKRIACIKGIAEGIAHLNQHRVVHRDLKPANILLSEKGNAVICDFGISQRWGFLQGMLGDLSFIPLETVSKRHSLQPSMDSWGLACVATCILLGKTFNEILIIKANGWEYDRVDCRMLAKQMNKRLKNLVEKSDQELQKLITEALQDIGSKSLRIRLFNKTDAHMTEKQFKEFKEFLQCALELDPKKRLPPKELIKLPFFSDKSNRDEEGESKE